MEWFKSIFVSIIDVMFFTKYSYIILTIMCLFWLTEQIPFLLMDIWFCSYWQNPSNVHKILNICITNQKRWHKFKFFISMYCFFYHNFLISVLLSVFEYWFIWIVSVNWIKTQESKFKNNKMYLSIQWRVVDLITARYTNEEII